VASAIRPHGRNGLRNVRCVGATALLSLTRLAVDPGGSATCDVRVRNTGSVVDQFTFEVVGDAATWATLDPPALSLFPGAEGTTQLRFDVPRSSEVRSGEVAFGVKVISREDPDGTLVEEGLLEVGRFSELGAELLPRTARGRRMAMFELAFDNRGNERVTALLSAIDPDGLLGFRFDPPSLVADPNSAVFARMRAVPRARFLRGEPQTRPFQVLVEPDGQPAIVVDGTMLQEPVLPRWFWKAVLAALLLLLVLVLLWFTVLKPTVESAAKDAVAPALAANEEAIEGLAAEVAGVKAGGGGGGGGGGGAPTTVVPPDTTVTTLAPVNLLGDSFDRRLAATAAPGATATDIFKVEAARISLTDIVLQNPNGDGGFVEVRRGPEVIVRVNLANFRDLDYHFVSPYVFTPGQEIVLAVQCKTPGDPVLAKCSAAASLSGFRKATP
jgi:hypothetical protein